jgi:hypothetical protein
MDRVEILFAVMLALGLIGFVAILVWILAG